MNEQLAGRVALVTGAQQGIGRATALAVARAGAAVVVNHFDGTAEADEVVDAVRSSGGRATAVQGDVSARDDCARIVAAGDEFGGVDLLVNNAGIFPRTPFLELSDQDWESVLTTNLQGTFMCSQEMARGVVANDGSGAIVNVASLAAFRPSPRGAHYSASKAGIVGFTHSAAIELAPHGIRMNCVAPGIVDTAQPRDGLSEAEIAAVSAEVPVGQMATPDDIADVIVFLLSGGSRHITGQTIHVNGGQYTV